MIFMNYFLFLKVFAIRIKVVFQMLEFLILKKLKEIMSPRSEKKSEVINNYNQNICIKQIQNT